MTRSDGERTPTATRRSRRGCPTLTTPGPGSGLTSRGSMSYSFSVNRLPLRLGRRHCGVQPDEGWRRGSGG